MGVSGIPGSTRDATPIPGEVDITNQMRTGAYDLSSRFQGQYRIESGHAEQGVGTVDTMFLQALDRERDVAGRFGRQSLDRGGVLGHMDGVQASIGLDPLATLNAVTGAPAALPGAANSASAGRFFYGVNMDLGRPNLPGRLNLFALEQRDPETGVRRTVGSQIRYFRARQSLFGVVHYNLSLGALSTALILGRWILPDKTSLNVLVDYRRHSAMILDRTLPAGLATMLRARFANEGSDPVDELDRDITADHRSVTIGAARALFRQLRIGGSVTFAGSPGAGDYGGFQATGDPGRKTLYSLRVRGQDLWKRGDAVLVAMRYGQAPGVDVASFTVDTHYPLGPKWRVHPRLAIGYRAEHHPGADQATLSPSLQVRYYLRHRLSVAAQAGGVWRSRQLADIAGLDSGYYFKVGYRATF
ncbi:MAG: hypothetical protein B7Z66_07865 [Chromatiales bacterium 21-64-14]|nr:MAG: hypothetical protein B7Z66_07865 [Chromatiales bacterium 21-64-14]HQU15971.1 hypothetical protein [Gammaproteobacteria bacterium]